MRSAVKESSGNVAQISEVARTLPAGKTLLSGDDNLALASIAVGAEGLVSVLGNMIPKETKQLVDAARAGRRAEAVELNNRLLPLIDALFVNWGLYVYLVLHERVIESALAYFLAPLVAVGVGVLF